MALDDAGDADNRQILVTEVASGTAARLGGGSNKTVSKVEHFSRLHVLMA